jgi:hypothetical protein
MADRVSARRGLTNTFFLTLNTGIFTVIGLVAKESSDLDSWVLVFPLIVVLGECAAWWWLVRSYRQLNSAKFVVVGLLEKRLPHRRSRHPSGICSARARTCGSTCRSRTSSSGYRSCSRSST